MLDGGVVVFSAREGVEAQSETVWQQADKYHVPRIAFINKMDREGADFFGTLDEIREPAALPSRSPLSFPVGQGPPHVADAFRGLIDLVTMQMLTFPAGKEGHRDHRARRFPPSSPTRPSCGAGRCSTSSSMYSDELTELMLAEEAGARGARSTRCSARRRSTT